MSSAPSSTAKASEQQQSRTAEAPRGGSRSKLSSDALDSPSTVMSHESSNIFHRKASHGKSPSLSRSFFSSRASVKKSSSQEQMQPTSPSAEDVQRLNGKGKEKENGDWQFQQQPRSIFPSRSIIPDPLSELPPWYTTDVGSVIASTAQFRSRYPMHNPIGPRWYRNHHLAPPTFEKRPPSVFSPSFPPMAAGADRLPDPGLPGPSRTPSSSPLPTPSSSQIRIHDIRGRTRKVSQTAHDNVDMLDVTDPWGTNWHHQSPYDVGHSHEQRSPDSPEGPPVTRQRRMSMTASGSRHKTMTPSPLSQSTSAVHLPSHTVTSPLPRRLSKNRKPFRGLFGGSVDHSIFRHASEPPTPIDGVDHKLLKRGSSIGPSVSSKERRGSVLGRLVKRFSVMRKSDSSRISVKGSFDDSQHSPGARPSIDQFPSSAVSRRTPSPQKAPPLQHASDVARRIPPPSLQDEDPTPHANSMSPHDAEAASVSSVEPPYSIGKLTVANPDEPCLSAASTPVDLSVPLPSVPERSVEVEEADEPVERIFNAPLSRSPAPLEDIIESSPLPIPSRLSTILSADHTDYPEPSPSPPLPELPPPTPFAKSGLSLPPTPQVPPSPSLPEIPSSPTTSVSTFAPDSARNAISPLGSSAFRMSLPSVPDETPLSRVSILANPPTPHVTPIVIPTTSITSVSPPSQHHQKSDPSPTKKSGSQRIKSSSGSSKSRQTETFKLVRSPSGNVHTVGESFVAGGEHWEVVESSDTKKLKKERTRSKDIEKGKAVVDKSRDTEKDTEKSKDVDRPAPSRRESKRHDKGSADDDSDQQKGRDRRKRSVNGKHGGDQSGSSTATVQQNTEPHSSESRRPTTERRRSSTREKEKEKAESVRSTQTPTHYSHKQQPSSSQQLTSSSSTRRERKNSTSTRPSSDFQSGADLNALKAKEAWDLERLWKGHSVMYGPDGSGVMSTRPTIGSDSRPSTIMSADIHRATSIPSVAAVADLHRASTMPPSHGSSHTYFMVQTPAQGPIPPARYDYPKHHHSFPEPVPFPSTSSTNVSSSRASLSNPLPEPPRLSSYKASPLPDSLAGSGDGPASLEYWTKYAGVTTTH
ncbi:hypothetical protein ABKN59_000804 [Abortiporus biennis]